MKPVFREVKLTAHIGRAIHLIDAHCAEVTGGKPYNPDIDYLLLGDRSGLFRTFIIEDGDTLVGYAVFMITKDFITSKRSALNVAIYVDPQYRGRVAVRYIKFIEMMLVVDGVKMILFNVPPSSKAQRCLSHFGYSIREHVCSKEF